MDYDYQPPVKQLLTLGMGDGVRWEWPDYLRMGLTEKDIPELIRMATDKRLNHLPGDQEEVYAPIHAWRALGQFEAKEATEPLLTLLNLDNDWSLEELPEVMALIGPAAIPALDQFTGNGKNKEYDRIGTARALEKIGNRYRDQRENCIEVVTRHLKNYRTNPTDLNAFLISYLIDLKATEAVALIEEAYAAKRVELSVLGDWEGAQIELGLLEKRITPARDYLWESILSGSNEEMKKARENTNRKIQKKKAKRRIAKASRKKSRKKREEK